MKPLKIMLIAFCFFVIQNLAAQTQDWKNMNLHQKQKIFEKMNTEKRINYLKTIKEDLIIDELQIAKDKIMDFRNLYSEYQESQHHIREKFRSNRNFDYMTNEEAKKELENSFVVGQQLLDNRKYYSKKFLKIISPQQVLKMFQNEGRLRNIMKKRMNDSLQSKLP